MKLTKKQVYSLIKYSIKNNKKDWEVTIPNPDRVYYDNIFLKNKKIDIKIVFKINSLLDCDYFYSYTDINNEIHFNLFQYLFLYLLINLKFRKEINKLKNKTYELNIDKDIERKLKLEKVLNKK